jgi:integrase
MRRLTQALVEGVRPGPARREISDLFLPALRLIVQPTGSRSWAVRTRVNGRQVKITLGSAEELDLAAARRAATAKLAEIAEAPAPRLTYAAAGTLGDVAELYLAERATRSRRRTLVERERHLRRDWAVFADRPLGELRRREVRARLEAIATAHGPVAANRARSTLHALYGWAIRRELVEVNPVSGVEPFAEDSRERVLSLAELRAIWAATASGSDYDSIIRLLVLSGQRRDEVASLRWAEVDLAAGRLSLPGSRTKNGRPHVVPMSTQIVEILAGRPRGRDFVFGEGAAGGYSGWSRSKARLDPRLSLPGGRWVLHDLRRSFVTHLAELGVAPAVVEAIVNHVSGVKAGVAGIYNRSLLLAERARALQLWANTLLEEVAPAIAAE